MSKLLQALLTQNNLVASKEDLELSAQEGTLEPTPDPTPESQELKQPEGQPEGLVTLNDGVDENSPVAAAEPTIEPAAELQPEVQPEVPAEGVMAPADGEQAPVVGETAPAAAADNADTVVTEPSLEDLEAIEEHHAALVDVHEEHAAEEAEVSEVHDTVLGLAEAHAHLEELAGETEAAPSENAEAAAEVVEAELSPEVKSAIENGIALECAVLGIPAFGVESLKDRVKVIGKAVQKGLASAWEALKKFVENVQARVAAIFKSKVEIRDGVEVEVTNRVVLKWTGGKGKWSHLMEAVNFLTGCAEELNKLGNHKSSIDAKAVEKITAEREQFTAKGAEAKPFKVTKKEFDDEYAHLVSGVRNGVNKVIDGLHEFHTMATIAGTNNNPGIAKIIKEFRVITSELWAINAAVANVNHQLARAKPEAKK
jgi:hypothetical protein